MTNQINITISGPAGAGKTRLAHKIALLLLAENVHVNLYDEESLQKPDRAAAGVSLPMHVKISTKVKWLD